MEDISSRCTYHFLVFVSTCQYFRNSSYSIFTITYRVSVIILNDIVFDIPGYSYKRSLFVKYQFFLIFTLAYSVNYENLLLKYNKMHEIFTLNTWGEAVFEFSSMYIVTLNFQINLVLSKMNFAYINIFYSYQMVESCNNIFLMQLLNYTETGSISFKEFLFLCRYLILSHKPTTILN